MAVNHGLWRLECERNSASLHCVKEKKAEIADSTGEVGLGTKDVNCAVYTHRAGLEAIGEDFIQNPSSRGVEFNPKIKLSL